jgi:hypothetical protein
MALAVNKWCRKKSSGVQHIEILENKCGKKFFIRTASVGLHLSCKMLIVHSILSTHLSNLTSMHRINGSWQYPFSVHSLSMGICCVALLECVFRCRGTAVNAVSYDRAKTLPRVCWAGKFITDFRGSNYRTVVIKSVVRNHFEWNSPKMRVRVWFEFLGSVRSIRFGFSLF